MKKKNKIIIFIMIVVMILGGVGYLVYHEFCKKEVYKDKTTEEDTIAELEAYLKENYSKYVIDGSTSLIPLHEALEEKFGEGKEIKHSKTVSAFNDFVDGKIDILLAVDYLDSYFESAAAKNVEINKKEITKEALVFLKNKDLKVDNLTLTQIKQIFNKTITSWGSIDNQYVFDDGYELQILPIYRNQDSGSGMALINLLGNKNFNCTDDNCLFINEMGAVINALADGLKGGNGLIAGLIAYNMYTFSEKQFHNENVETFKIDGVKPNDDTIYNNEYPVILYNYIYYKNDEAKEFGEKLYQYLISSEGQKLIMENGYVPLKKQSGINNKDTNRNCIDNFVDEACVKKEGYNEEIKKYVKINITNDKEDYEYFDTVEEYIFANSDITREQFNQIKELLAQIISESNKAENTIPDYITFTEEPNGDIKMSTNICGGSACIWFVPLESYNAWNAVIANENECFMELYISKNFKTMSVKKRNSEEILLSIPIEDFLLAFTLASGVS